MGVKMQIKMGHPVLWHEMELRSLHFVLAEYTLVYHYKEDYSCAYSLESYHKDNHCTYKC